MSYINVPEFNEPFKWVYRIRGYVGVLDSLAKSNDVISIDQINYSGVHFVNGVQHYFFNNGKRVTYFPRRLHKLLREWKPDVVIVHGMHFPLQIIQLRLYLGKDVKIIVQNHADRIPRFHKKLFLKVADKFIDAYFFTSGIMAKEWIGQGLINKEEKVKEIMMGSSVFEPMDRYEAMQKTRVEETRNFLWVGRLDANKDPVTLVKAFIDFSESHANAKLYVIYQSNELLNEIKDLIHNSGNGAVQLVGKVAHDDIQLWINSVDYIISTSHYEAFGLSIVEAMSCGCIPIVTNIPSFQKITGLSSGILFEPGNVNDLVCALKEVINKDIVQERERTLQQFNNHLSFDAIANSITVAVQSL